MKRFFTAVPLQVGDNLKEYRYQAADNEKLQPDCATAFPIVAAISGYTAPGESFAVVAALPDSEPGRANFERLRGELDALCVRRGLSAPTIEGLVYREDQRVGAMAELFLRLCDQIGDDDELFACMTYGTKPVSTALMLAMQYGHRAKRNVTIDGIVYGEIVRPSKDPATWEPRIYDETGLVQLGETARLLSESGVRDPSAAIRGLLGL